MSPTDRAVLEVASGCKALKRHANVYAAHPKSVGVTIKGAALRRLIDSGLMKWVNSTQSAAVLTEAGKLAMQRPPPDFPIEGHTGCELCARPARLTLALLRKPWSDETVKVRACTPCARVAWRTLELIGCRGSAA